MKVHKSRRTTRTVAHSIRLKILRAPEDSILAARSVGRSFLLCLGHEPNDAARFLIGVRGQAMGRETPRNDGGLIKYH